MGLVVLWLSLGVLATIQRGDFADGNCSTITDTALAVVVGPLNFAAPETLAGTCNQATWPAGRSGR